MRQGGFSSIWEGWALEKPITKRAYVIGLLVVLASVYSQYLIWDMDLILRFSLVYGIPIVVTSFLLGPSIIRRSFRNTPIALKYGLGFFGVFIVLGAIIGGAILFILLRLDPKVIDVLNLPNPLLQVSPDLAWIMVLVSLLVVGPAEEYLFRGFVYGGLLSLSKCRHWLGLALLSSLLFSAIHLYYAFVYGLASLILFTLLTALGMAMAATYYVSDGNLIVPIMIHGVYDATGFVGVITSVDLTLVLRGLMILIGIIVAIVIFVQKFLRRDKSNQQYEYAESSSIVNG